MTGGEVRDLGSQPPYAAELRLAVHPTPEEQVRFIANIERILSEGSFVATYKYALLVALVDLAIERGDDSGAALPLRIDDIAEKFAELYWRQAAPYGTAGAKASGIILHQNQGKQAAAIRLLSDLRRRAGTLTEARRSPHWRPLVAAMRTLLRTMPLWRLQKVAHDELVFLYGPGPARGWITLLPGVAGQLRERATLIRRLAQTEWLRFVLSLKQNHGVLGGASGLSEFLFGSSRIALGLKLSRPLRELQQGRCFYCRGNLKGAAAVDHFIPWSRYPRDLTHNLVLAHAACNAQKSDALGGETHLEQWTRFVADEDEALTQIGTEAGLLVDRATSVAVAEWSYEQADRVHAPVWLGGKRFGHLSGSWRQRFAAG